MVPISLSIKKAGVNFGGQVSSCWLILFLMLLEDNWFFTPAE